MTAQFDRKNLPPVFSLNPISYRFQPIVQLSAFRGKLLTTRFPTHLKIAFTRPGTIVRKTQKVKRMALTTLFPGIFTLKVTECYPSALCRMNFQALLPEPVL